MSEATQEKDGLVYFGQPVKVLSRHTRKDGTEVAKLGGYLVVFSGADSPDLTGDYFTAETDFGTLTRKSRAEMPAYYQHGFDPHFKGRAIGDAEVKQDEFGVWAEYQLELRSDYERHLVEMAEEGKMGQSSGAVAHLVERKSVTGDTHEITRWPLGEASLTPTPAEPRTSAIPLKSLPDVLPKRAASGDQTVSVKVDTSELQAAIGRFIDTITQHTQETAMSDQTKAATQAAPEHQTEGAVKEAPSQERAQRVAEATLTEERVKAMIQEAREDAKKSAPAELNTKGAPAISTTGLGDTEAKAYAHWLKTGRAPEGIKASNATDMNIGTDADGGYAVPTGHYNDIIARRDESALWNQVGVRNIPGVGTTVNVPVDNEDDGEFISTAEAAQFDLDAPALGQVAMTLVKYTKRVQLSYELLEDEESRLLAFLSDFVGRGMAKTENDLLVTEVDTNGSNILTTASTTAIAAGEPETIVYDDTLNHYIDSPESANWIMRPSTYGNVISITGNDRLYAEQVMGSTGGPRLMGHPVRFSNKVDAYGTAANKFGLFGNFSYVGRRQAPGFTVLRDPYSRAANGQVVLHYYFRVVYAVLQSEAVGYIDHAAA